MSTDTHDELDVEENASDDDEDEAVGMTSYSLITYPADWTLEGIKSKWDAGAIRPAGMQRHYVWKQPQASALIESFIMELPVPPIYLYRRADDATVLELVDGYQRVRTYCDFVDGLFGEETAPGGRREFRLQLRQNTDLHGRTFRQLSAEHQARLRDYVLRAFIIRQVEPDDDSSVYHVFERLNTGGTPLNAQEVRNCVYDGEFRDLLREMNERASWREILGMPKADKRYKDVELILRFLALRDGHTAYTKPMKSFMNDMMQANRHGDRNAELRQAFESVSDTVREALGTKPFHLRTSFNAPVFDAVFVAFALAKGSPPSDIAKRYQRLKADLEFVAATEKATTDDESVKRRIKRARRVLFGRG